MLSLGLKEGPLVGWPWFVVGEKKHGKKNRNKAGEAGRRRGERKKREEGKKDNFKFEKKKKEKKEQKKARTVWTPVFTPIAQRELPASQGSAFLLYEGGLRSMVKAAGLVLYFSIEWAFAGEG